MRFSILLFLILTALCQWPAAAQQPLRQIEAGQYEQAAQALQKALNADPHSVETLYGLARLYADTLYAEHQPDTAYDYLRLAQRHYGRLSKGQQKRMERQGIDRPALNKLRLQLNRQGLEYALAQRSSSAVLRYLDRYQRLHHDLEKKATGAFLELRLEELRQSPSYDSLIDFAIAQESRLREYRADLIPNLHDALFCTYFSEYDSTDFRHLRALLEGYPPLALRLDAALSAALRREPYITRAEGLLRGSDYRYLPQTAQVIYEYHYITGELSDLLGFQNRFPDYAEAFDIQRALTAGRFAPDLKAGFSEDKRETYQRYIEIGAPTQKAFVALQQLIAPQVDAQQWASAAAAVKAFAPFFGEGDPRIAALLAALQAPDEGLEPLSLGSGVNSYWSEYAPVISADGQQLFFCRFYDQSEDIYRALREGGSWGRAEPFGNFDDPMKHEAPLAISADGSTLLLYDGGEVKYINKTAEGWSSPLHFFPSELRPEWQGTTTFASNREAVILAARTFDVVGARNNENIDLFVSLRQADGSWGKPVNLGPVLNTPFEERSPFLHPDMRTLYFSSSGHGGLGKLDVFVSKRLGDGWFDWTPPVNLGKEINGPGNDWGYRITTDGAMAYFSAGTPEGHEDLFAVGVPEQHRPEALATIKGRLLGTHGRPVAGRIALEDLGAAEQAGIIEPDPQSGEFFFVLPAGKLYSFTVTGKKLYPLSDNLDLRGISEHLLVERDIIVPTIDELQEGGITLALNNIFFDTDQYAIKPESYPELERLATLVQSEGLNVEIAGHTDNVGGQEYNLRLSQNRADAARDYLLAQGCRPDQVSARGYGMEQPIASNASEAGRAQNRRVEIRFRGQM
jgi:outer membrane protein OmpA-like peptidoglycan-associated protein